MNRTKRERSIDVMNEDVLDEAPCNSFLVQTISSPAESRKFNRSAEEGRNMQNRLVAKFLVSMSDSDSEAECPQTTERRFCWTTTRCCSVSQSAQETGDELAKFFFMSICCVCFWVGKKNRYPQKINIELIYTLWSRSLRLWQLFCDNVLLAASCGARVFMSNWHWDAEGSNTLTTLFSIGARDLFGKYYADRILLTLIFATKLLIASQSQRHPTATSVHRQKLPTAGRFFLGLWERGTTSQEHLGWSIVHSFGSLISWHCPYHHLSLSGPKANHHHRSPDEAIGLAQVSISVVNVL